MIYAERPQAQVLSPLSRLRMLPTGGYEKMELQTIEAEDVLAIHEILVSDFAASNDPISPAGVRSVDLLQSAVSRQHTSFGGKLKYPAPIPNAATLLYGLCNDHPFHNGNKRTALVSMLVHLERNKLTVFNTSQDEMFEFMLKVASHGLIMPDRRARRPRRQPTADQEVDKISDWLIGRCARVRRGEHQISYRELRRILERFGFLLVKPKHNSIEIVKEVQQRTLFGRLLTKQKHIATIGWPGEHRDMSISEIKKVRTICHLREEDGVDSDAFYDNTAVIDSFVNRYRTLLRRLAKV